MTLRRAYGGVFVGSSADLELARQLRDYRIRTIDGAAVDFRPRRDRDPKPWRDENSRRYSASQVVAVPPRTTQENGS